MISADFSIIIPLPRIHQHHFCIIESATDVQVLLANSDHDKQLLLLQQGGIKQLGMKHVAQGFMVFSWYLTASAGLPMVLSTVCSQRL